jgi:diguanylate cyclase (GGDEF)-like protein
MSSAAPSFLNPIAAEGEAAGTRLSAEALARRAKQRRQIQGMIGVSYVIDAAILQIYAYAGAVPFWLGPVYALAGLSLMALAILMSETGVNERFKDHYMVAPQSAANMMVMVGFTWVAPQVGVMFLCSLFTVFSFASLRSTPSQTAVIWTAMALGLAWLFLLTDKPIAMPHGSHIERFATMLVFTLTIGRCMFLGIFSSALKASLYQSGQKLKEAYRRIEELAELDELTGSFNRRCIMRMLDEEIARAARSGSPCSVALIDLDHFKRVNDTYGHPTGDEVLRTFAITMFANIRSVDRFGRYGGEEFLLVLPDMPEDGAARAMDRLRAIVAELDWSAFSSGMKVTISAGVATLKADETTDSFLARADSALYAAKAKGRNRIARA